MLLQPSRATNSRNASATLAFHQYLKAKEEEGEESKERADMIQLAAEKHDSKWRAKLHIEVATSFQVLGPKRDSKPEVVCDALELGRVYVTEGSNGARTCAKRLERRRWSPKEIEEADEEQLETFSRGAAQKVTPQTAAPAKPLLPPGEGWTRHDDEMLVDQRSQVYFVQIGPRAGTYLRRRCRDGGMEEVGPPHAPREHPVALAAASASWVRRGAKFDRAVLLNDITKIARLALKFPLSFLDTPACAYALFQGLRSAESSQWCAENFHKKLLPLLAEKIHSHETAELQELLGKALEALDAELLDGAHPFSGVSALLALVLGERLVVAGVGRVRAALLPERGLGRPLLGPCAGDPAEAEERRRLEDAGAAVRDGLVVGSAEGLAEAPRILAASSPFEVLQVEEGGPADEKHVRSLYRRLALRVHPDKQPDGADTDQCKRAFARLDEAKDVVETLLSEDAAACRELHRVLRGEVHTRAGASALLGGTEDADEAARTAKALLRGFEKLRGAAAQEYDRADRVLREAVATLRRTGAMVSAEALPRQEALLREGLATSRAMGARDLRRPRELVFMKPETAATVVPGGRHRLALLCGATAALSNDALARSTAQLARQPKASALRWCLDVSQDAACSSAVCVLLDAPGDGGLGRTEEQSPAAKRQKTGTTPDGTVRARHLLFAHQQLRQPDPLARRAGAARNLQEAEQEALAALERLLREPKAFGQVCREMSDCQSAAQPGTLTGDLGWVARGLQEPVLEDVIFSLGPGEIGDLVTSSRGVHVVQRLA